MMIISSREFRDNQKKYFDLVDQNKQVIVQRGKDKAYILAPIGDIDCLSVNDALIEYVKEAEVELSQDKSIPIKDPENIWESIL
ncbi:MAG: type II toxin-antitoxin system Phd/YefM family antitoxin [Bacteroidales bacterium]|nr:type II toxin-antitoxin system Phd/YefM family antitoxin [Bacteroidales bacterium]